jgi:hypothetical protein
MFDAGKFGSVIADVLRLGILKKRAPVRIHPPNPDGEIHGDSRL